MCSINRATGTPSRHACACAYTDTRCNFQFTYAIWRLCASVWSRRIFMCVFVGFVHWIHIAPFARFITLKNGDALIYSHCLFARTNSPAKRQHQMKKKKTLSKAPSIPARCVRPCMRCTKNSRKDFFRDQPILMHSKQQSKLLAWLYVFTIHTSDKRTKLYGIVFCDFPITLCVRR